MTEKYVMVPVPESQVPEVMRLLVSREKAPPTPAPARTRATAEVSDSGVTESFPEYAEMSDEQIRDSYERASPLQKKILEYLAGHPETRFGFPELAKKIGVGSHAIPGSLGRLAASRKKHYDSLRPYRIFIDGSDRAKWRIWMDQRAATILKNAAAI